MINFDKLKKVIGINVSNLDTILTTNNLISEKIEYKNKMGGTGKRNGKVIETFLSILLDEPNPNNTKGSDFKDFEVKTVTTHFKKSGDYTNGGDTPICDIKKSDYRNGLKKNDFELSNIFDKTKSIIAIMVDKDSNIIHEIKHFDGFRYYESLYKSFLNIINDKRSKDDILIGKKFGNKINIMLRGNRIISLSDSILDSKNDFAIEDQYEQDQYITNLISYKKTIKSDSLEQIIKKLEYQLKISNEELSFFKNQYEKMKCYNFT